MKKHSRGTFVSSLTLASALLALTFSSNAMAAKIIKIKGDRVLAELDPSDTANPGDRFVVMVGDKKRALVEVEQSKGGRVIARIVKGTPEVDGTLVPLSQVLGAPKASDTQPAQPSENSEAKPEEPKQEATQETPKSEPQKTAEHKAKRRPTKKKRDSGILGNGSSWGAVAGYSMDSQDVTATSSSGTTTESISMSGSGFSLKAFGDIPIYSRLFLMGRFGFEQFTVTGSSSRGSVKTDILYGTGDLLLRYGFMDGNFIPFVLGGFGLHYPLSKSSDVLNANLISTTTVFFVGGGANIAVNEKSYVHGSVEYGIFPPSNDVKTSMIAIRLGMGFKF